MCSLLGKWKARITGHKERSELPCQDLLVFENCPRFPLPLLLNLLPDFDIVALTVGPSHLGWPIVRDRLFTYGCCKGKTLWVGPRGPELQTDFADFFHRRVQLSGDVFAGADDEERQLAGLRRLAKARRVFIQDDAVKTAQMPEGLLSLLAPQVAMKRGGPCHLNH